MGKGNEWGEGDNSQWEGGRIKEGGFLWGRSRAMWVSKWNAPKMEPAKLNGIKEGAQQREEETHPPAEKKGWGERVPIC